MGARRAFCRSHWWAGLAGTGHPSRSSTLSKEQVGEELPVGRVGLGLRAWGQQISWESSQAAVPLQSCGIVPKADWWFAGTTLPLLEHNLIVVGGVETLSQFIPKQGKKEKKNCKREQRKPVFNCICCIYVDVPSSRITDVFFSALFILEETFLYLNHSLNAAWEHRTLYSVSLYLNLCEALSTMQASILLFIAWNAVTKCFPPSEAFEHLWAFKCFISTVYRVGGR